MQNQQASFDIPTEEGIVAVDLLNDEYEGVLDLLKDERVNLDVWVNVAAAYYQVNKIEEFENLLKEISDESLEQIYDQTKLTEGRIKALNTLIGYYIEKYNKINVGSDEIETTNDEYEKKREELSSTISKLINEAEQLDVDNPLTYISKGVLYLSQGDLDKAEFQFDYVLTANKGSIPALLGRACIKYNRGLFKDACSIYEQCLRLCPNGPADIRLGLGLCHYQLGHLTRARQCFDRVLELDPNNVSALVALAVMDLNSKDEALLQNAVKNYLRRAYASDPNNAMVLNLLGNHFFFKRDTDKTQSLAFTAYHNSKVNKIKAESCYNMARAHHLLNNYDMAFKYYYRIVSRLWPEYNLARFGLGQLYIQNNDIDKAIEEFEYILKSEPENIETNEILGHLYAKKRDPKKCLKHMKKVLGKDQDNNVDALLRVGEFERTDLKSALDCLLNAKRIMEEKSLDISYELYNNIAVHQYKLSQYTESEENFRKALSIADCKVLDNLDDLEENIVLEHVTMVYNIARLFEVTKKHDIAEKLYCKIAAQHPSYVNVYLRLSKMYQTAGNQEKAIEMCKIATTLEPVNPLTWAFTGQIYLEQNDFSNAQKSFEHIINNIDKSDIYALLGMGNIYFRSLRANVRGSNVDEKELKRTEKHLDYAQSFFEMVLKLDGNNMYGALNSGCVLCEKGYVDDGKSLITKVREVCIGDVNDLKDIPETYVNLGHLCMIQKQYVQAEKYYSVCSKRFFNDENDVVLMFLAKAYFDNNKLENCLEIIQKLEKKEPENITIKFNIGVTYYEKCNAILSQKHKDLNEGKAAQDYLEKANKIFTDISNREINTSGKKTSEHSLPEAFVVHKAKEFLKLTEGKTKKKLDHYFEKAQEEEKRREELKKKQEEAFKLLEEETRRKLEEEERQRREKEEEMNRRYRENQNRLAMIISTTTQFAEDEEDDKNKKKNKKRKKKEFMENEELPEDGGEYKETEKKKKKKKSTTKEKKSKGEKKKKRLKKKSTDDKDEDTDMFGDVGGSGDIAPKSRTVESDDEEVNEAAKVNVEGEEEFNFDD